VNWRAIRAIVRKDLKVVFQNKGVMIPIVVVPLIFLVVLPGLAALAPLLEGDPSSALSDMRAFLENMPAGMQATIAGYDEIQTVIVLGLVYFLAPMYLILPLMVASVIAADSFAGEKERKTLEALLYTPTSDRELLVAKMLSAMVPAVTIAWVGFLLYSVTANVAAWSTMGRIFFPNLMWVVLAIWVAPAVAGLGLGITVLVSARAETFQEAYQLGGVVVLPILLLVVGQATGVLYFSSWMVLVLGLFFWIVDAVLLTLGARRFRRSELAVGM
jgi:ABC-2 type transport system permease protein